MKVEVIATDRTPTIVESGTMADLTNLVKGQGNDFEKVLQLNMKEAKDLFAQLAAVEGMLPGEIGASGGSIFITDFQRGFNSCLDQIKGGEK